MDSPFRISDIEICLAKGDLEQLRQIMDFSEVQTPNFEEMIAKTFGRNVALLMNNGWESENLIHRQDYSLAGELCDDSYFDIFERKKEFESKHKNEPYKAEGMWNEIKRGYIGQVIHFASCIKVIQESLTALGKDKKQINHVLEQYVDSFVDNLDFEKISKLFGTSLENVQKIFLEEFSKAQSWTEKLAGQDRAEGIVMDEAIYNSHINNENKTN